MELSGAQVAVIGLGASGMAAARLVLERGGEVYVSDRRADAQTAARGAELRAAGAGVDVGKHDVERVAQADLVVVSPGIPPSAPVLRELTSRGIRWISEPELAVRFFSGPLIAITGTNGKTTTTVLTAHLLEAAGSRVAMGGNVGGGIAPAASELALREPPDWYVLELSSFQLAGIEKLRPDIGVITNLSPDHLDRYATVEEYYADKARLFENADYACQWVLPADEPDVERLVRNVPGHRYRFGEEGATGVHAYLEDGVLTLRTGTSSVGLLSSSDFPLLGRHNLLNALAAALTANLAGAEPGSLGQGLRTARPLPHRLELVLERGGIMWVNDSKATNVAATRSALDSLDRPVVLLLGGKDKGEDFRLLRPSLRDKVRQVVVFGAAGERIAKELEGAAPLERLSDSFDVVVRAAAGHAREGDIVLLSPACSSFDMFENYEDRGRRFAALVEEVA